MRQRNILRKLIQFSLKQCGFFQISLTWILERGLHPIQLRLLLKGFQVSKNWQCTGKILGLFFLVCFVLKWKEISETIPFCTFGSKQCVCLNYLYGNSLKNWHLKATKTKTSKYCIWNVRQSLEAKLTSWWSSFNFLWKGAIFFKVHWRGSTTGDCTTTTPVAVQRLPSLKELTMRW